MVRMARFLKEGVCYYVESRGYRDGILFEREADYQYYLDLLKKYRTRFHVAVYAYCLLPSEVHLIVHPLESRQLPLFMQGLNQSYAFHVRRRCGHDGKVWGQRYKSTVLHRDEDLFGCIKRVEFLPVKRNCARSSVGYEFSSCASRIIGIDGVVDAMPPRRPIIRDEFLEYVKRDT